MFQCSDPFLYRVPQEAVETSAHVREPAYREGYVERSFSAQGSFALVVPVASIRPSYFTSLLSTCYNHFIPIVGVGKERRTLIGPW